MELGRRHRASTNARLLICWLVFFRKPYVAQLWRDHGRKYGFWSEVPIKILSELESEQEAKSKPEATAKAVVDPGRESKGLGSPGTAAAEAGSVQPGLW
jgi:hypothetical protein